MPDNSFMTAYVEIRADVDAVKKELDEIKKAVKDSAKEAEDNWKKASDSISGAIGNVASSVKKLLFGAGVIGTFKYFAQEAMKTQDSIFLLGSSLKISGEYSKSAMEDYIAFADTLQRLTVHSNEEVLMNMRLAKSLDVSSDKLKVATMWAIGLSDALGLDLEASTRYVSLALGGEFRMLSRYIPLLKTVNTEQEKLAILQEFATRAFGLSGAKAETASGSIKKMWNEIKDLVQVIGLGMLPVFSDSIKTITAWAQTNEKAIGTFAAKAFAHIEFVKDVIIDLVGYMKKDFTGGCNIAFKLVLELAKGFGESLAVILGAAALKAGNLFIQGFVSSIVNSSVFEKIDKIVDKLVGPESKESKEFKGWKPEFFKIAPIGPELETIARETSNNLDKIVKESNLNITASSEELKQRLIDIKSSQGVEIINLEKAQSEELKKLSEISATADMQPARSREAREAEQTLKQRLLDMNAELNVQKQIVHTWRNTKEMTELQALAVKASADNTELLATLMKQVNALAAKSELARRWEEFGNAIRGSMNSAFEDMIFQAKSFEETMVNIGRAIVQEFIKIQFIKPFVNMLSQGLTSFGQSMYSGVAHGGGEVGSLPNTRMVPSSTFAGAKKYHGLQQGEQAIIAKEGEVISNGQPATNITLNLSAIDTQSGLQFLAKNQNMIAGLFQKSVGENSPARRRR